MTFGLRAISIITTMTGTEATPLRMADQISALIGLTCVKLMAMPIKVATASTP